jgi:hypothetical protein
MERALPLQRVRRTSTIFRREGTVAFHNVHNQSWKVVLVFCFFHEGVDLGPPLKQCRTYREYIYDTE